ncbi:hypothetical protein ACM39_11895 [Chryseobacterium sp. FH2]|uniref:T9SS type A sorting domain-containing protein n=1 Tax=Chryseobacterium sp. FH2 TaxID=1674291 RepID=UPI00065AD9A7|nr:T9SS type A sorting domain-containing protein [Chryseobacterium sp. FH2]KMQ67567.1 hypothetical protein ACM39_11895 [Chryseobacterium sp. FH2]
MVKNLSFKIYLPLIGIFFGNSVNAQCNIVDSFSENFDTYTAPESIVPTCWDRIALNGASQIISSTSPASGTGQIYQFGYGSGKTSIVIFPKLSNVNAGTHHFKFKAKANSGGGFLEFGYITDISDASTFVVLKQVIITNSTYDSTAEKTITVPTTIPADVRLGIRNNGATFAGYYWDDAVWEPIPNLGTHEAIDLSTVKVYPNPVQDILNISDVRDVKSITITDAVGRMVKFIEKPSTVLQVNDLEKGIYFVALHYKNGSNTSTKIIKK